VSRELRLASGRQSRTLYVTDRGAYGHDADMLAVSARPTRSTRLAGRPVERGARWDTASHARQDPSMVPPTRTGL